FEGLGGRRLQRAKVRVTAATNRDLKKAVDRGDSREALYYRLQVFAIRIPPLRERTTDVLELSEAFLRDIGHSFGRPPAGLTRDARPAPLAHHRPGHGRRPPNPAGPDAHPVGGGRI